MNTYDYILAIDQGGHASRATLYSPNGDTIVTSNCDIKTQHINVDGLKFIQHDSKEIVQSIQSVISDCAISLGNIRKLKIKAGIATQRSTIVCWNYKTAEVLSNAISWQDTRASHYIDKLRSNNNLIKSKTGLFLSAHYGASKIKWCLNNMEAVQQAYQKNELCIAPLSSYLLYSCVDGLKRVVDPANAARTLLFNRDTLDWDAKLLELFSIPKSILPECVNSSRQYGQLLNWDGQCDVVLCTGDQSAAVLSHGIPVDNEFTVNIGSGAFVLNINEKSEAPSRILSGSIYTDGETTINAWEGTVNSAGTALDWLQKQNPDINIYQQLPMWLKESDGTIPLFINGISGVGSPYWIVALNSRFIGEVTLATKAIAIVESIVFLITENINLMKTKQINNIKVSGGLSIINDLCQKLSDLSVMEVNRTNNKEATQLGLLYLMSDSRLNIKNEKCDKFTPNTNLSLLSRFSEWKKVMANE